MFRDTNLKNGPQPERACIWFRAHGIYLPRIPVLGTYDCVMDVYYSNNQLRVDSIPNQQRGTTDHLSLINKIKKTEKLCSFFVSFASHLHSQPSTLYHVQQKKSRKWIEHSCSEKCCVFLLLRAAVFQLVRPLKSSTIISSMLCWKMCMVEMVIL